MSSTSAYILNPERISEAVRYLRENPSGRYMFPFYAGSTTWTSSTDTVTTDSINYYDYIVSDHNTLLGRMIVGSDAGEWLDSGIQINEYEQQSTYSTSADMEQVSDDFISEMIGRIVQGDISQNSEENLSVINAGLLTKMRRRQNGMVE